MSRTGHVVFCEDKFYLLWQTELLLNSLTSRANVSQSDIVVLFADPGFHGKDEYEMSPYLRGLTEIYNDVCGSALIPD